MHIFFFNKFFFLTRQRLFCYPVYDVEFIRCSRRNNFQPLFPYSSRKQFHWFQYITALVQIYVPYKKISLQKYEILLRIILSKSKKTTIGSDEILFDTVQERCVNRRQKLLKRKFII